VPGRWAVGLPVEIQALVDAPSGNHRRKFERHLDAPCSLGGAMTTPFVVNRGLPICDYLPGKVASHYTPRWRRIRKAN